MPNGNIISSGTLNSPDIPGYHSVSGTNSTLDLWLIQMDPNGNKIWERAYGGEGMEWFGAGMLGSSTLITQNVQMANYIETMLDKNGNLFFAINSDSRTGDITQNHYNKRVGVRYDIWFLRLNLPQSTSFFKNTIRELPPASFSLKLYPNPFSERFMVQFNAMETTAVSLEVFSAGGARVATIALGNVQKGQQYSFPVKPNQFPSGSYYYRLRNGKYSEVGNLIRLE